MAGQIQYGGLWEGSQLLDWNLIQVAEAQVQLMPSQLVVEVCALAMGPGHVVSG